MQIKLFNSMSEVPKEHWNSILNQNSCTNTYEFWEIVEQSNLNDFCYKHILFYNDAGEAIALSSFYTITTDIAIFAPTKLRKLLQHIRKLFPNFLKVRMLECGTPVSCNKPFISKDISADNEIMSLLSDTLLTIAKQEKHFLIVLRDFEAESQPLEPLLKQFNFHLVSSLPTTYMDILWPTPEAYLASMKSYYRSKLLKHLRINQANGIRHELHDDFADLAEVLCNQWLVVHHHAVEFQREVLTPEFYREFSLKLGTRSKVILFYRHDELVGHALLLLDGDFLRWLYFGRNDARNDSLYLYVGQKVVETAIILGAKQLDLGFTTYAIKKDIGAYMSEVKLALKAPSAFINFFVGHVYPLLNHTPEIDNKTIFKAK